MTLETAPESGPLLKRLVTVFASVLVFIALVATPQWFIAGPLSERCAPDQPNVTRYAGLEWKWLPVPGQYCRWVDNDGVASTRYALVA